MSECSHQQPPTVAMTMWRRDLSTYLGERTDLFTLGSEYHRFFADAGLNVVLIPECKPTQAGALLAHVSGLVLTGGEDLGQWLATGEAAEIPSDASGRDTTEYVLLAEARRRNLPVFGICRGMQLMAAAHGSQVTGLPQSRDHHPYGLPADQQLAARHTVTLQGPEAKAQPSAQLSVNSIHEQAISHCPDGFQTTAVAEDGTIEAITTTGSWYAAGVQWHPEKMSGTGEPESQTAFIAPFLGAVKTFQSNQLPSATKETAP